MTVDVTLRAAGPADDVFLRRLHAAAHCAALSSMSLDGDAREALLRLQFESRRAQYRARYPDAVDRVVIMDGLPVGHCWTSETPGGTRLLDLAVVPDRLRRGIADAVLALLLERVRAAGVPLRLSVWSENVPALALYRGRGLREATTGADPTVHDTAVGYRELEWAPTPARTS